MVSNNIAPFCVDMNSFDSGFVKNLSSDVSHIKVIGNYKLSKSMYDDLVVYTNGLLTEYKQNFYNGAYWYQTYQYDIDIPLPTFDLSEYEETEPSTFKVYYVDWSHEVY